MGSRVTRTAAIGLGLAAFVAFWLFFAPSQVGGSATYSTTSGISMEPMMHKGDLAIVRAQKNYKVGEVVLYNSPALHRAVLHRILVIQNGHYYFKGDNNGFVDPGYATRSMLVGSLWLHIPTVGGGVAWVGRPAHAAVLSAIATVFLLMTGAAATKRRRRRRVVPVRSEPEPEPLPEPAVETAAPVERELPEDSHWWYVWNGSAIVPFSLTVLLAGVIIFLGFTASETRHITKAGAYRHSGVFSYTAKADRPSPIYPTGVVSTGEPIFTTVVHSGKIRFEYFFQSRLAHRISGTIALKAQILQSSSSWKSLYTLSKPAKFTGDATSASAVIDMRQLYGIVNQLTQTSGAVGADYTIAVQAIVRVVGDVGTKPVRETFAPVLPFSVTKSMIKLDAAPATTLPGASYQAQSVGDAAAASLNPSQVGAVPGVGPNYLTLARYRLPVKQIRLLGFFVFGFAFFMAAVHALDVRRKKGLSKEELVAGHFRSHVVPVASLNPTHATSTLEVVDFATLARLARFLERPILLQSSGGARTYAVDDGPERYLYHAPQDAPAPAKSPVAASVRSRMPSLPSWSPRGHRRRVKALRVLGMVAIIGVAITLITSFTATTIVPLSNAGTSSQPRDYAQLTPNGCSSLTLTSLVVKSGTFSNSKSNALVVGSSGKDTMTDTGRNNCIVLGGGSDTVNGNSGDYCVVGPGSQTNYKSCTKVN